MTACRAVLSPRAKPPSLFPFVEDKLQLRDLCRRLGVPAPESYGVIAYHSMVGHLADYLGERDSFVIKPNRGAGGRGVLVITGRAADAYMAADGQALSLEDICDHVTGILAGDYSPQGRADRALIQQRIQPHPALEATALSAVPDIRIICYRSRPAVAMLRLPTLASRGLPSLHQGAVGAVVNLYSGTVAYAVHQSTFVDCHPDTGVGLTGMRIPFWGRVLDIVSRLAAATNLVYLRVDVVLDAAEGPMILDASARLELALMLANRPSNIPQLQELFDEALGAGEPMAAGSEFASIN